MVFLIAVAFFSANTAILQATTNDIIAEQRAAEEAKKPAEVEAIAVVTPRCTFCYDVMRLIDGLEQNQKVAMTASRSVDAASAEGAALIKQYQITRSPFFILRGQTEKLLAGLPTLKAYGQLQGNDFVGAKLPPPYVDLVSGATLGTFEITYITEKACKECYDPTINRQALRPFNMVPAKETTIDRTDIDGQRLIKQYNITTTPTIILTGDLDIYDGFNEAWKGVGTIESDGAYVFRSGQDLLGTYYDLVAKKTIVPKKTESNEPPQP